MHLEFFGRGLLFLLSLTRLLGLMHRLHDHPLVCVVWMIHPRIVLMVVLPPHHVLGNHPMRLSLVVLGVAGMRSWSGRLKSLWLFSLTRSILLAVRPCGVPAYNAILQKSSALTIAGFINGTVTMALSEVLCQLRCLLSFEMLTLGQTGRTSPRNCIAGITCGDWRAKTTPPLSL